MEYFDKQQSAVDRQKQTLPGKRTPDMNGKKKQKYLL